MEQPPDHDRSRHNQQPEYLVAPVETPLFGAPRVVGELLVMGPYATF